MNGERSYSQPVGCCKAHQSKSHNGGGLASDDTKAEAGGFEPDPSTDPTSDR